jgi:hypothetical protein
VVMGPLQWIHQIFHKTQEGTQTPRVLCKSLKYSVLLHMCQKNTISLFLTRLHFSHIY